ncbi:MAG: CPA2 family monovalent cation:H+ antiporter-2, partial [Cyclobacteriaceae bacterium]
GSLLDQLPIGLQTLAVLLSVGLVALSGKYVIVPVLRLVATTGLRELFTASALLIVIAISFLMEQVGLSPALGAFLGGVILANSEYKHELESNLDPFKGLLLGLFFIAVGASINFKIIGDAPVFVGGLVLGTILIKTLVLLGVGKIFKLNTDQNLLFSIGLSQVGEFAFVLLSFSSQLNIIEQPQLDLLLVITALSMTISPIIGMINERLILPRIGTAEKVKKAADSIESKQKVILVGFGHFGSTIGRFLRANGVNTVILDHDSNRVDLLRRIGFEVYYGDATREDLLESAGAGEAQILISAIDDPDANMKLVKLAQKHFTNLKLVIRAKSRVDAYQLLNLGVENVYRESLDTSIKLASDVLGMMGHRKHTIAKQANKFIKYDEASMRRLSKTIMNSDDYISKVREEIAQQETLLRSDLMSKRMVDADQHWDADQVRDEQK